MFQNGDFRSALSKGAGMATDLRSTAMLQAAATMKRDSDPPEVCSFLLEDDAFFSFLRCAKKSLPEKDYSLSETPTIIDNRTGRQFEIPIEHDSIRATDLRQIKVKEEDSTISNGTGTPLIGQVHHENLD